MPSEEVQKVLNSHDGRKCDGLMVLQMATTLQSRALVCLNNLIESMSVQDLGGNDVLFTLWKDFRTLSSDKDQVVEAATSAMRAVTQKLCSAQASQLNSISKDDLQQMLEFGANHSNFSVRTNVVHIAGSLGQFASLALSSNPSPEPGLEMIVQFLIMAATSDTELRVVSEALDKLFDVFSEDYTDSFCKKVDLVSKMRKMQPGLKVKIDQKKRQGDHETAAMASMAKKNLNLFIRYKEKKPGTNGSQSNGNGHC